MGSLKGISQKFQKCLLNTVRRNDGRQRQLKMQQEKSSVVDDYSEGFHCEDLQIKDKIFLERSSCRQFVSIITIEVRNLFEFHHDFKRITSCVSIMTCRTIQNLSVSSETGEGSTSTRKNLSKRWLKGFDSNEVYHLFNTVVIILFLSNKI